MATHESKGKKQPAKGPSTKGPSTKGNSAKNTSSAAADGKDANTYNPVGMAGKKAGIVEEIEQQLHEEASDDKAATSGSKGGATKASD